MILAIERTAEGLSRVTGIVSIARIDTSFRVEADGLPVHAVQVDIGGEFVMCASGGESGGLSGRIPTAGVRRDRQVGQFLEVLQRGKLVRMLCRAVTAGEETGKFHAMDRQHFATGHGVVAITHNLLVRFKLVDFILFIPSTLSVVELDFHPFHAAGGNTDIVIYKGRIVQFMGVITCHFITRHVIIVRVLDRERAQLRQRGGAGSTPSDRTLSRE